MFMEIFMLSAWSIWKERNGVIFQGIPHTFASWRERLRADLELLCHRVKPLFAEFITYFLETTL